MYTAKNFEKYLVLSQFDVELVNGKMSQWMKYVCVCVCVCVRVRACVSPANLNW
jgi:hypothetical protein